MTSSQTEAVIVDAGASTSHDWTTLERRLDRLLADNSAAITRLASSYTNTLSDRDDLVQEIAMAVWQALRHFREECSERTFLFRIAHNRAITFLSRSRVQAATGKDIEAPDIEARDPAPDPETGLAQGQQADLLQKAIHRLPLVYRQAITLSLEGLGYGEIAEVLGISGNNVGARLSRARQMLRELLENRK